MLYVYGDATIKETGTKKIVSDEKGGKNMEYREVIKKKNKILSVALLVSVALRGVVNGIFIDFSMVIGLVAAGLILAGLLFVLSNKVNPIIMMYLMVAFLTGISIACMIFFPCTTNYLMFFLAIFMIVLYEDIRPIALQCVLSAACMIFFYLKDPQKLAETWSIDAMAMCIVYIISAMFVFGSLCYLTGKQFEHLRKMNDESNHEREKAESLLEEIKKSVDSLEKTNGKINESITATEEISGEIAITAGVVAKGALQEVFATETIKSMVEEGVDKIRDVSDASVIMTEISNETNGSVFEGGSVVRAMNERMQVLNEKMDTIATAITELNEENERIVEILGVLDEITSQTNLLSLNASIEAARAGEHGKGFSVVAMEIRNLSDNSSKFTEEIQGILSGIQARTRNVKKEIETGQDYVNECSQHMQNVDMSFQNISENTSQVLSQAQKIEKQSKGLEELLGKTLTDVSHISENVSVTSSAMEEISAGITQLHGNVDRVVSGYNDINEITGSLVEAQNR